MYGRQKRHVCLQVNGSFVIKEAWSLDKAFWKSHIHSVRCIRWPHSMKAIAGHI